MRLLRLELRNFKGIRSQVLESPAGGAMTVLGDNATGKTTLFDAWLWLLFGKDSAGAADFAIKTLDESGKAISGLDHSVEARLALAPDRMTTLKKVFHEVWRRKRGAAEAEFAGHTTDHFVDDAPVQKAEYDAAVAAMVGGEERFRLLTDPAFFAEQMDWRARRRILFETFGDVTMEDVVAGDPKYSELQQARAGRTIDTYRKVVEASLREARAAQESIPTRIDENDRSRPAAELLATPEEELLLASQRIRMEIDALAEEKATVSAGGASIMAQSDLRAAKSDLEDLEREIAAGAAAALRSLRAALEKAQTDSRAAQAGRLKSAGAARAAQESVAALQAKLERLEREFNAIQEKEWQEPAEPVCPTCQRPLSAERADQLRLEALKEFNSKRAAALEANNEDGRLARARLTAAESELDRARREEAEFLAAEREAAAALEEAERALVAAGTPQPTAAQLAVRTGLQARIEELKAAVAAGAAERDTHLQQISGRMQALSNDADAVRLCQAAWASERRAAQRRGELEQEGRNLGKRISELERLRWLMEEAVRERAAAVESKINSAFQLARFRLFRTLVNGAVEECCDVTYDGVAWGEGLNHGARIAVGLDIIRTFSEMFKAAPPVFIDQCESVTVLPKMRCQLIRLVVSAAAPELTVVHE